MTQPERYITPNALPTAHQREILTILAEECNEAAIAASKMMRFGKDDHNPYNPSEPNAAVLGREIGELYHMVARAIVLGLIDPKDISRGLEIKERKLAQYLQTDPP